MSDLWWRITKMKKEAKSPAAIAHKRKYETQYESTPARKKYRRELERERRKRGVAGKGGKDMSHTKEGKIVPEEPHTNRARSHPSVGSTLKMVIVKAPQMNLFGHSAECEMCNAPMSGQEAAISNQQMGASVCSACLIQAQEQFNQENDMMFHSEPMDVVARLLKAPLYDITTGKQVAGKPTPMPDLKDGAYEYRFDYASNPYRGTPMTDLLYVSPDQSTRAKVMLPHNQFGGEPRATIPLMGVHKDKRGQGKGREALRNLKDELREIAPEVKNPPRPLAVGGEQALGFWSQMGNEGLADFRIEDPTDDEDNLRELGIEKGFPAKYPGNCKVCGRYIQQGEEVNYNPNLGGVVCPRDCGRVYVV